MRNARELIFVSVAVACLGAVTSRLGAAELEAAFIFSSYNIQCPVFNQPDWSYTVVHQATNTAASADFLSYNANPGRGWGYEELFPGALGNGTYDRFAGAGAGGGPVFDESPNSRTVFSNTCPEHIYNSFIGAKNFSATCNSAVVGDRDSPCTAGGLEPQGIIFRVDVPNGKYRFVAVVGSADNRHAHRILAEDGGEGFPANVGPNHVVLVSNFDQAEYCAGHFAHVAFGCYTAPPANGPVLHNIDSDGLVTDGYSDSPTLEVTEGYIRFHQLQGNSNDGSCGARDANGGNLVLLEIWRVGDEVIPPGGVTRAHRSIDPLVHAAGQDVTVTLTVTGVTGRTTIIETTPEGYTIAHAGGGQVDGGSVTFVFNADGNATYTVRTPGGVCRTVAIQSTVDVAGSCAAAVTGDYLLRCAGALSLSGGVPAMLIIGPIGTNPAGDNCNEGGLFLTSDYLTDGDVTERAVLVREGDVIMPDFFGAAAGLNIEISANPLINPNAINGEAQVWVAAADANGLIMYTSAANGFAGISNFVAYSIVYLENTAGDPRDVILEVGSDDAVKVRFNGDLVHTNSVCRGVPGLGAGDMVPVTLFPGKNVVLAAIMQAGGGAGVRLVVRNPDRTPLLDGTVVASLDPPAEMPGERFNVWRTIDPPRHEAGDVLFVTLTAEDVDLPLTVVETFPAGYTVVNAGGGTVQDHTIHFTITADGEVTYSLQTPLDKCRCSGYVITGQATSGEAVKAVLGQEVLECNYMAQDDCGVPVTAADLVWAFAFGTQPSLVPGAWATTPNVPDDDVYYTAVEHLANTVQSRDMLIYNSARGWGYEVLYPMLDSVPAEERALNRPTPWDVGEFWILGPFDNTENARNKFPVPFDLSDPAAGREKLYDSFIGAKNFTSECSAMTQGGPDVLCDVPQGIVFRVDVPNGRYRFVAAVGDADHMHAHRILAEDGGEGPPHDGLGSHVVLVHNFDQAQYNHGQVDGVNLGEGVFARVGFDGRLPPMGDGIFPDPQFVNMDANGMATTACPSSPTLEVTQGYIRFHQLQGNSNAGCGGPRDRNGGDLVLLEIWAVDGVVGPKVGVRVGDANGDGMVNIADAISLLSYLFVEPKPPIPCFKAADANNDNALNIADAISILSYLFAGGGMTKPDGTPVASGAVSLCQEYDAALIPATIGGLPACATPCRP